jgi:hypothetical protein
MDSAEDLLTFITSSVGGRNAIAKLLGKVAKSPNAAQGKMPVVQLEVGSYEHADFGVVSFPVFKVIDWAFWDAVDEAGAPREVAHALDDAIPFAPEWRG